jgi:hypothetical protein
MSIAVGLERLAETLDRYRSGYLLTVGENARAHVVAVNPRLVEGTLRILDPGRRTQANAAARPSVTVLWPPPDPSGYSLIVDGNAGTADGELTVTPTRAVLHRPAPPGATPAGGGCTSDCVELPVAGEPAT